MLMLILLEKDYTMTNGKSYSKRNEIKIHGNINPKKYEEGYWYVEGVGEPNKTYSSELTS